ncbi:hypothetical protein HDU98_003288 [Podochytrium sp. JEL0797]|nr:hypothetical protein HDU98_003286 [Podochytrium sp. JEL0797]KAJ3076424.1 hypothetical protein HDU98_003288 [Podochytrium sp. JEL0797]
MRLSLIFAAAAATSVTAKLSPQPFNPQFTAPLNPPTATLESGKRLVVYYANWDIYGDDTVFPNEDYHPADLPISHLSDINYAFYNIANSTDGVMSEVPVTLDNNADFLEVYNASNPARHVGAFDDNKQAYFGNFGQFMKLKMHHDFNFGLSIGGWSNGVFFSSAMKQPNVFINGIFDLLKAYPGLFNRIDIDWEYIQNTPTDLFGPGFFDPTNPNEASVQDAANFATFLQLLRERLDKEGLTHFEISAALPAVPNLIEMLPLKAMSKYLDLFNVMTYDMSGSKLLTYPLAGPQANVYSVSPYALHSVDQAIQTYLAHGVPAHKITIGVAMYSDINGNTTGLGQPTSGAGSDVYNTICPYGNCDYRQLPLPGSTLYWDSASKSSYSYDPVTKDLLSFDTVYSVAEKCQYVWDHGLAGFIAWEASGDTRDVTSKRSLMGAMSKCLSTDPRRNHGTPCSGKAKGCAATALATCVSNAWVVKDCPSGQVCLGEGQATKCGLPTF